MVPITLIVIAINLLAIGLIIAFRQEKAKAIAVGAAVVSLLLSLLMIVNFVHSGNQLGPLYIPYLNLGLTFGLTGISAVLLLMSEIVILVTAVSGNTEKAGFKASASLISLFQIAAFGIFTSTNLLLFFVFWDIGVVAMFLMINVLGSERRKAASINFLLYELFASAMLLLAIILLYTYTPIHSLNISYLISAVTVLPANVKVAVMLALFLAFMTNMAIFPLHSWLPDAYTEASTQGSMLLAGILTKFGGYGMIILFMLSGLMGNYLSYIGGLAAVSVIYAALMIIRQKDLKRIVSYAAMLEMGVILFAISASNSVATYGAVYGMLSQGISIALAFLAVGAIKSIFDERNIDRLRDIVSGSKSVSFAFATSALSILGFPLTSGFIAAILIFFGAVQGFGIYGLVPLIGVLIMGGFMYSVIGNCFLSKTKPLKPSTLPTASQRFGFYALAFAIIAFGVLPFLIMGLLRL